MCLSGCYGVTIKRTSADEVQVRAHKKYTVLLAPDGTAFIDQQGQNRALLEWFGRIIEGSVDRAGESIQWRIGESETETKVIIQAE
jgi:hypothetical protein